MTTYYEMQLRNDTAADWTSANPKLLAGELGYETDTGKLKIGDGSTLWNALSYINSVVSVNSATGAVTINAINQLTSDVTTSAASGSQAVAATVAKIQGTTVTGTTGTGAAVLSTSPTLVTPALGTPASGNLANCTGVPNAATTAIAAATPSTIALRDANANTQINNINEAFVSTATAAGTTTLTVASAPLQQFTGTTTQTVQLPAATTLVTGCQLYIFNRSTGALTIKDGGGTTIATLTGGNQGCFTCAANGSTAGSWDQTITYTGTLPVSQGGTGATTSTGSGSVVLATGPAFPTYMDFTEQGAAPAAPSAGNLRMFAQTGDSLAYENSAGTVTTIGTGSGQKNYLALSASTVTGWTAVAGTGAVTQATVTASTDTTSNSPRPITTKTSLKMVATAASGGTPVSAFAWATFELDPADYNTKLQLQWAQNIASYTASDYQVQVVCSASAFTSPTISSGTRLPLSTDSSSVSALPALEGTYRTTFDAPGSSTPYIMVMFIPKTTATSTLYVSDLVVGPGTIIQGAAFTQWASFVSGSWKLKGSSNGSEFTNYSVASAKFARLGSLMHFKLEFDFSGAPGTGTGAFTACLQSASGYTMDSANAGSSNRTPLARGFLQAAGLAGGTTTDIACQYTAVDNGAIGCVLSSTGNSVTATSPATIASGDKLFFEGFVPIAEWAGSGTVNVVQNDVEYAASTTGTWDAAAASTNTVYGPAGAPISGSLTATRAKTVQFLTPVQQTDRVVIEYLITGSSVWIEAQDSSYPFTQMPSPAFGANVTAVPATNQVTITFNQFAYAGTTWNSTTGASNWSSSTYSAWRLKKTAAGQAVGFSVVQPGVSSGLVSASGVPGNTTGNAIATGYVGETIQQSRTTASNVGTTATIGDVTGTPITVGAGIWAITGMVTFHLNGATWSGQSYVGIGTASGNNSAGLTQGTTRVDSPVAPNSSSDNTLVIPSVIVSVSASTTYYLKYLCTYSAGTPQLVGSYTAVRIA